MGDLLNVQAHPDAARLARQLNGAQRSALHDVVGRDYWQSGNWWRSRNGSILLNVTVRLLRSRGLVETPFVPQAGRERVRITALGADVLEELERMA